MPYLTPDTNPVDTICRVLFIPNSTEWIAIVTGALEELTFTYNFESYGSVTPDETVSRFVDMFDNFCFNVGQCRVIGEIIAFAGSASPYADWLVCDGASLLRADYPDLFNVIGTLYGSADVDHFNIPDLQGRSLSGAGTGSGLAPVSIGQAYGEQDHTLTLAEMPTHTHTDSGHTHAEGIAIPAIINGGLEAPASAAIPGTGVTGVGYASISNAGSGNSHNNVGPRLGVNYLIVAKGR